MQLKSRDQLAKLPDSSLIFPHFPALSFEPNSQRSYLSTAETQKDQEKMSGGRISEGNGGDLLNQFELILDSDPLIDEVGFIHPSQFVTLDREVNASSSPREDVNFWIRDHKLGISTSSVILLYKSAKEAFMDAMRQYRRIQSVCCDSGVLSCSSDEVEREVMRHSKALLLLSCDFATAWNARKLIVSKKENFSAFDDELQLSAIVLSYSPKSEQAWGHRRWVIKRIAGKCSTLQEIVRKESELVENIAERSKMNYRAWNHRCWMVSYMTRELVLHQLKNSRNWASLHVADNSCFHYRTRLMLRVLEGSFDEQEDESSNPSDGIHQIWQEELDWNKALIMRYVGREALWLHRRFLSLCWIQNFATVHSGVSCNSDHESNIDGDVLFFLEGELHLINSCSTIPDDDFEDFRAQALHSATYILWLMKQIPESQRTRFQAKLNAGSLKTMLNSAYPERSSLWDI